MHNAQKYPAEASARTAPAPSGRFGRLRAYEDTGLMPEEIIHCRSCDNFRQNAHGVCYCNEYGGAITPEDYYSRVVRENEPPAK